MKRSETPDEVRKARQSYIETRWTQLSDLTISWGDEAIKYLLVVNTGAMAGTLGFIGAMPHIRPFTWPKIILLLFAAGVVLVGVYHAVRYHRIEWLFTSWRQAVADYVSDKIEWNVLLDRDEQRSKKMTVVLVLLAYASLLCFLVGLLVAAANFHQITNAPLKETVNERAKTTEPPSAASNAAEAPAKSATGTKATQRTGQDGSPEGATTGSGSSPTAIKK